MGLPYFLGGRTVPPDVGYDCAGFVMEAYHRQGVNITHVPVWPDNPNVAQRRFPDYGLGKLYTSAQRLFDNPMLPEVGAPRLGDLAFWERTYQHTERITHVLMYLGPKQYLGAQSPRAGIYANDSAWWTSRFAGYRRVVQ